ncbi:polysaccharide pyruvyl transferase family protein [Aliikangiella sp. IMCC44632]
MKVAIITTIDHNIGDDFIREGLEYILKQALNQSEVEFSYIHKHSPITSRKGFEWFRYNRISKYFDKLPLNLTQDRILDADLIVQSGAPIYWCHDEAHCYNNEWYQALITRRSSDKPILNLAGGSCQTFHSKGDEFCHKCNRYIKEFHTRCSLTTYRDHLAQIIAKNAGVESPVIPCSSIFANDNQSVTATSEDYVVLNYMRGGAHFTFGQEIKFKQWEQEFSNFYRYLSEKENVIFACHNDTEYKLAKKLAPKGNIFYQKNNYAAYLQLYSKAKFAFANRIHCAYPIASLGKRVVLVGNDSRVQMAKEIGIDGYFVNDVSSELLIDKYKEFLLGNDDFSQSMLNIKSKALQSYISLIKNAVYKAN